MEISAISTVTFPAPAWSHSTPSCSHSSPPLCLASSSYGYCFWCSVCQRKSASMTVNSVFPCGEAPPRSKELSCANVYKKYSNSSVWNHPLDNIFLWLSIKMFMQTGPRSISSQNPTVRHSCILQQHSLKLTVTGQSWLLLSGGQKDSLLFMHCPLVSEKCCTDTVSDGSLAKKHCCSACEWVPSTFRKLWHGQFPF